MKNPIPFPTHYPRIAKYLGLALVAFCTIGLIYKAFQLGEFYTNEGVQLTLGLGLMMLLFSKERNEDERTSLLKYKALAVSFLFTFSIIWSIYLLRSFVFDEAAQHTSCL